MLLTAQQLSLATGARIDRATDRLAAYSQMMTLYEINTRLRMACFLAQVGHESCGFKYGSEIWGPSDQQKRYERDFSQPWPANQAESMQGAFARNRLAWRLGNVEKGDGHRYGGHGDMQITGRTNHAAARDRMRRRLPGLQVPDFEAQPLLLAELPWAAFAAGDYWDTNNINQYADAGNFDACCDEVNRGKATLDPGDSNGFDDRLRLFVSGMRFLP